MSSDLCTHISDHRLDLYSLARLPDPETAELEEHLLVCDVCRERLTETDHFIAAVRYASVALDPAAAALPKPMGISMTLIAATLLVLALTPALTYFRQSSRPLSQAVLLAVRGGEPAGLLHISPARTTALDLDLSETTTVDLWKVKVVNGSAAVLWTADAHASAGMVRIRIGRQLDSGKYWVRLYDAAAPAALIREYGFEVR